jgi:hypothetical protein
MTPESIKSLRASLAKCDCTPEQVEALVTAVRAMDGREIPAHIESEATAGRQRKELRAYKKALETALDQAQRLTEGTAPLDRAIRERTRRPRTGPLDLANLTPSALPLSLLAPVIPLHVAVQMVDALLESIPAKLSSGHEADRIVGMIAMTLYRHSDRYAGEESFDFEILRSEGPGGNLKDDVTWVNSHRHSSFMAVVEAVFTALEMSQSPRAAVERFTRTERKLVAVRSRLKAAEAELEGLNGASGNDG